MALNSLHLPDQSISNSLIVCVLKNFWEQTIHKNGNDNNDWNEQIKVIHHCGKGIEETIRFLYNQQPSLENFLKWMIPNEILKDTETLMEDVLSRDEIDFFIKNGYVVIQQAISAGQCREARTAILEYLGADITDPASWYKPHEELKGLMLMFYHHPALDANRNSPRIRKAYEQLYGTTAIHKVVDKVSFNPPETSSYKFAGSPLHWDVSLVTPVPFKLQGLLYLNDVDIDGGAFHCVPGFHNRMEEWLNNLPQNVNPRNEAIRVLTPKPIAGNVGDFIIWHQALPHCATANHSSTPRFVQYHTYDPDNLVQQEIWK